MQNITRFIAYLSLAILIVSTFNGSLEAANPYYFSEEKPKISASQLTNHYKTTPFSPKIEIGKISYLFPAKSRRIFWTGRTDIQTRPYEMYAVWYSPDGSLYERQRCKWKGTSNYRTNLKLPRKKKKSLLGQWRLEIQDATGDVLVNDRFYIGPALNIVNDSGASSWQSDVFDIKDADALILNHQVDVRISKELGITKTIYKRVKILNKSGKRFNEFYEPYKENQFPKIKFAHAVLPDGQIKAETQQFPGVLQRVPPHHQSARVMFVRMLRAEADDILEYEMTFEEPFVSEEDLIFDEFFLQDALPTLKARYSVTYPDDIPIQYFATSGDTAPQELTLAQSKQRKLVWEWQSVAPLKAEEGMPPYSKLAESIMVSSASEWQKVSQWWDRHTVNKYKQNDELLDLLRRILLKSETTDEKIAAIYKYVKYKVSFKGFDLNWSNPEPLPSVEVLKSKTGDSKGQAVLLKTFLNEAGIEADIAWARMRNVGPLVKEIPGLGQFNQAMVIAYNGNKKYYLDPTQKFYREWTLPSRNIGADLAIVTSEGIKFDRVPEQPKLEGRREVSLDLVLNVNLDLTGTLKVEYFGREDARIKNQLSAWDQNQTVAYVRDEVSEAMPYGNFAQVEVFNQKKISRNARLESQVNRERPLEVVDNKWKLPLVGPKSVRAEYVTSSREHSLELDKLRDVRFSTQVVLPAEYELVRLPQNAHFDGEYLSYHVEFSQSNNIVLCEAQLKEKRDSISLADYPNFRKEYEEATLAISTPAFIQKKDLEKAKPIVSAESAP